jgi:chaperonin GroES
MSGHECKTTPKIVETLKKYEVPFVCTKCGGLDFPYEALRGITYIWPRPVPELHGTIYIPEKWRINFKASIGVLLSSGDGVFQKSKNRFVKSWVTPGDVVMYDRSAPWTQEVVGSDGQAHLVDQRNILDILHVKNVDEDNKAIEAVKDTIVVKVIKEPELSRGGLWVPQATEKQAQKATVVSVGEGNELANGSIVPMDVKVGDTILFLRYKGVDITTKDGKEFVIIKEDSILAITD